MSGAKGSQGGLTRRSFLKTTGAIAGAAAVGSVTPSLQALAEDSGSASGETQTFSGSCRAGCFASCYFKVKVRDGKVVSCTAGDLPNPYYNRICAKGMAHPLRTYDLDRIKYPLRRVGERGSGEWERISWEDAINSIVTKWKELREKYGEESLLFNCNSARTITGSGAYGRLQNALHASSIPATYDWALMHTGNEIMGGTSQCEGENVQYAKTVFIWAANPTEAQLQNWHFLIDAKVNNGAKFIVIDPNYTVAASKADMYVPIQPGTDGVLAMAMTNIIIEEGLQDTEYLTDNTVAPFLVREDDGKYLRMSALGLEPKEGPVSPATGKATVIDPIVVMGADGNPGSVEEIVNPVIEGTFEVAGQKVTTAYDLLREAIKPHTPAKASSVCDVPEDTIYELARIYATNGPAVLYHSYGADRYYNGHTCYTATFALASVAGQIGKKGTAWGNATAGNALANFAGTSNPEGQKPGPRIPALVLPEVLKTGKFLGKDLQVKGLYLAGNNMLGNLSNRAELVPALESIELIVHADTVLNDTSKYADIVLPTPHWFETEDINNIGGQHPFIMLVEQAIDPLYESKSDFDIAKLLAEGMGVERFYTTKEDLLRTHLDTPALKKLGVDYDALKKNKAMRSMSDELYILGNKERPFNTPTGRAQFYVEDAKTRLQYGQDFNPADERLPHWFEPAEVGKDNKLREKFPLQFFQEHVKWRIHTQWHNTLWLREMDPEPIVKLNEKDAADRNIKAGDIVKVFNDRGYVVIKAAIHHGLRPGMINIPHGWHDDQFIEGHYNDLCITDIHPWVVNAIHFDALVEVEKV